MAISLDVQMTVTCDIVAYGIDKDKVTVTIRSKPTGQPARQAVVELPMSGGVAAVLAAAPDASKSRIDDLEYALLVYLRDNGFLG